MTMQNRIIAQYRQAYPKDTIREIAQRTSIQFTRVFRLLNGSPMRLEEYESFENCIKQKNKVRYGDHSLIALMDEASSVLNPQQLMNLCNYIKQKVFIQQTCTEFPSLIKQDGHIA